MIIGHGGDVRAIAERLCCPVEDIVDMSSNLNPLGPPEGFEQYLKDNIKKIRALPEADAMGMVSAFAGSKGIPPSRVAAGNGTTWFIYTLIPALQSKNVLILGPAYSDYKDACIMHDVKYSFSHSKDEDLFAHDLIKVSENLNKYDTVFICNPNNPTGRLIDRQELEDLVRSHPDTYFVVDESYLPFVEKGEELSFVNYTDLDNLIVLSSMSKIYTVPGLRTGFLTASPEIINSVQKYAQPWSVNALAQKGVVYLLKNEDRDKSFIEKTRVFLQEEQKGFSENLCRTGGIKLFPSKTSFVLAKLTGSIKAEELCFRIGASRILIRDCSNFDGLSDRFVRFSLKTSDLNSRLSELINKALNNSL